MKRKLSGAVVALLLTCATAFAQQTTGVITGRVVDQQGAAVPGVTVTAKSPSTGFTRTETSDAEGVYRLTALPVGIYDVTAELQGFSTVSKKDVAVNIGQTQSVDFPMKVASLAETVNVTGATPLIETTSSSIVVIAPEISSMKEGANSICSGLAKRNVSATDLSSTETSVEKQIIGDFCIAARNHRPRSI